MGIKRLTAVLLALAVAGSLVTVQDRGLADERPQETSSDTKQGQEKDEDFWMNQKLDLSKDILQALTMSDFKSLQQSAEKMKRMTTLEGFVRRKNTTYRQQLTQFDKANRQLITSAKDSDLTKSLQAFHALTASCVNCHRELRLAK